MRIHSTARFLSQALSVGLAAAIVLLLLLPRWDEPQAPVVEITEAESPRVGEAGNGQQGPGEGPVSYADAVAKAAPAVVNVHTAKVVTRRRSHLFDDPTLRRFFDDLLGPPRQRLESSLGSGVIVSPQGYVLTSHHVIQEADAIRIALEDGRVSEATVVGIDPETDLAVLKMDLEDLPSITLGKSESLRVGDVVLAIGNPFSVGQTVTMGIVSATGRDDLGISTFENFIQTDAAINPGNSGGALINPYGQLVGINTAIYSRSGGYQGIGFAIPVSLANGIMQQIIRQGRVTRGWVGIEIQELTPELAESFDLPAANGVIVAGVLRGGPAHQAGMRPGDVVTAVEGRPVTNARETVVAITQAAPGSTIQISVRRAAMPRDITVSVTERPPADRQLEGR